MAVRFGEKPSSRKGSVKFNDPSTTLEVWATGTSDESVLEAAIMGWLSDTYTVNGVTRFFQSYSYDTKDSRNWDISVVYSKSQDTNELTVQSDGGTRKMFQSLETVHSYNCITPTSAATNTLIADLQAAIAVLQADLDAVAAARDVATASAAAAIAASGVGGVDPAVANFVMNTVNFGVNPQLAQIALIVAAGDAAIVAANGVVAAAQAGDPTAAAGALIAVQAQLPLVSFAITQASGFATIATDTAVDAEAAAGGGNAQTLAAAAAATTAAADGAALQALLTGPTGLADAIGDVEAAAAAVVAGAQADQAAGGNGVPNFQRAVGVTQQGVDGVDVPDRKFEFSINKKLARSAISGAYTMELYGLQNTLNDASYTVVYNGQTLTFARGTLLFLGFPYKMTSDQVLDITYKFSAQRSILLGDNFRIGASGPISKTGWEYIWVHYREQQDTTANRVVRKPTYALVERCFEFSDFSRVRM